jgi:hypothetical protein
MQSTGQTATHFGHPEQSSGTITTRRPLSKIAPNSAGHERTQLSQVMHSADSIRRGGFFHAEFRTSLLIRSLRSAPVSDAASVIFGILSLPDVNFSVAVGASAIGEECVDIHKSAPTST